MGELCGGIAHCQYTEGDAKISVWSTVLKIKAKT
jgi:hypothetical protein